MEKAIQFTENVKAKIDKFKENNEHDKMLKKIFREVEEQKRKLIIAKRDMQMRKGKPIEL